MQSQWKEAQKDLSLPESQLKAALCRITHFEKGEVKDLRPQEAQIHEWLSNRGIKAANLYQQAVRKKSPYALKYAELRLHDKWRLVLEIKNHLCCAFPDKNAEQIRKMVRKVGRWEYEEVKELSKDELAIRDVLLRYQVKPATLYQWLLQTLVPEDVKQKIETGTISLIQARRAVDNREQHRKTVIELSLLEQARQVVKDVLP